MRARFNECITNFSTIMATMACGINKSNLIYGTLIFKEDRSVSRLTCDDFVINYTSSAASRLSSYPWSLLTVSCMGWLLVSCRVMHSIPASSAFRPIIANGRSGCARFYKRKQTKNKNVTTARPQHLRCSQRHSMFLDLETHN